MDQLSAFDVVRANVLIATPGHGRFSQWDGKETISIPLATLRVALGLDVGYADGAKQEIAALLKNANPNKKFSSWAGINGSGVCFISVAELQEFVQSKEAS